MSDVTMDKPNARSVTEPRLDWLPELVAEIDLALAERIEAAALTEALREAVRYAALDGGKRLRPVLCLLSCEAAGGERARALPAACALELVHAFSLVHDDLPAMDDDDLRRGKPTLHRHAGEAMAILAGDVMLSLAFECLAEADLADVSRQLTAELARGATAMITGQVYDTLGGLPEGLDDRQRVDLIHRNKTAALIRAACRMGAYCAGTDQQAIEALSRFGEAVGLMFQIVDDLLDVTQSTEHLGKAAGKDVQAGKLTYPELVGLEASRAEITRLHAEAAAALRPFGQSARLLLEVCNYLAVRTK